MSRKFVTKVVRINIITVFAYVRPVFTVLKWDVRAYNYPGISGTISDKKMQELEKI